MFASPADFFSRSVVMTTPCTIDDAIRCSGIVESFPELQPADQMVGVWGQRCSLNHELQDNDRVEVYRPLQVTPTEARRLRAQKKK